MILLQAETSSKIVETGTFVLFQYGAVGAILVIALWALYSQNKESRKLYERLDERHVAEMKELRDQFNEFVSKDRAETLSTIKEVSQRMHELRKDIISHFNK